MGRLLGRGLQVGERAPGGKGRSSIGQSEELGCNTVKREVSADPVGRAEAGTARVIPN